MNGARAVPTAVQGLDAAISFPRQIEICVKRFQLVNIHYLR